MGEVLLFRNGSYYKIKINKNLFLLNKLEQIDGFISDVQEGYLYIPKTDSNKLLLRALVHENTQKAYLKDSCNLKLKMPVNSSKSIKAPFPQKALTQLRLYYHLHKPSTQFFEDAKDQHKNGRSVQDVFEHASKNGSIFKKATVHTVRHCFATHLLESGVHIRYIKELLGHSSTKSIKSYSDEVKGS